MLEYCAVQCKLNTDFSHSGLSYGYGV